MKKRSFSLLGLMAMISCAAIGTSHVISSIRLSRANSELASLRERLELIPVGDVDHIAARRLPSTDENVRRWAVRIPNPNSKVLYANWGATTIPGVRDVSAKSTRAFKLTPDPDTNETTILLRVARNANDPEWGTITFELATGTSIITIDKNTTSLLTGDVPSRSEAIGDRVATRGADSSIILFAIESNGTPKSAFCLWLDHPRSANGG